MSEQPQPEVYLNGQFLPLSQARVSVMDRGFLFGDGVYEVIPCYAGRLFRLTHHLQRLDDSLQAIRMRNPLDHAAWKTVLDQLVAQLPGQDQSVYLQITRGASDKRDLAIPHQITPNLFCMTTPAVFPDRTQQEQGICAITLPDIRWQHCHIKATTLLANVLLRSDAIDQGAAEAILIRDGMAIEGATSNLFIVQQGVIQTPPKSEHLLPGITRNLVIELAQRHNLPYREADISVQTLNQADEIWITSSSREVCAVTELDGQPVANGTPGPIYRHMADLYLQYRRQLQSGNVPHEQT